MREYNYIVVKDRRSDKLYIDDAGSMIRNFEEVIDKGNDRLKLSEKYPDACDVSREGQHEKRR